MGGPKRGSGGVARYSPEFAVEVAVRKYLDHLPRATGPNHTARALTCFLDDPRISLDNNLTERGLRGVVLSRRNHHGSRSRRGTHVAALFYSLIESAKLSGVKPSATWSWPPAPRSRTAPQSRDPAICSPATVREFARLFLACQTSAP